MSRSLIAVELFLMAMMATVACAQNADNEPAASPPAMVVVNPSPPQTTLEKAETMKGAVVVRGYTNIGSIRTDDGSVVTILAVELKIPASKERVSGIVIEIQ